MLIRTEAPADILPIDNFIKENHSDDAAANLVMHLREEGRLTLSLLACDDKGKIVGHLFFSEVTLNDVTLNEITLDDPSQKDTQLKSEKAATEENNDDNLTCVQLLCPLTIAPHHRGGELLEHLLKDAVESLELFGYQHCLSPYVGKLVNLGFMPLTKAQCPQLPQSTDLNWWYRSSDKHSVFDKLARLQLPLPFKALPNDASWLCY